MDQILGMNLLMVSIESFSGLRWSQLSLLVVSVWDFYEKMYAKL